MFRLASTWLQALHEPAIVGLAVALFGLGFLLPLTPSLPHPDSRLESAVEASPATAFSLGLYDIPSDDQYYRDQWIAETSEFYAANPPREEASSNQPPQIRTASARTSTATLDQQTGQRAPSDAQAENATGPEAVVNQASHAELVNRSVTQTAEPASPMPTQDIRPISTTGMVLPARTQRWRVLTCLAAGLLASLLFASVWPAEPNRQGALSTKERQLEIFGHSEAIPLRLPSAWIALRPTLGQMTRRGILIGSYLLAAIGAWTIVF